MTGGMSGDRTQSQKYEKIGLVACRIMIGLDLNANYFIICVLTAKFRILEVVNGYKFLIRQPVALINDTYHKRLIIVGGTISGKLLQI
jgi:hypothetical protein